MSKRNRNRDSPAARQTTTTVLAHQRQFIGPLPEPESLAKFDQVVPGLAERIVQMAEGHARDTWRTNRANRIVAIMGQVFAFVLMIGALSAGVYMTSRGLDAAGVVAILGAIATPIVAMLYNRRPKT